MNFTNTFGSVLEKIHSKLLIFLYKYVFFYTYLQYFSNDIFQLVILALYVFAIFKLHISGKTTAIIGFVLLIVTMMLNIFGEDDYAGIVSQYVFLFFVIAFLQQFYHYIKYENK